MGIFVKNIQDEKFTAPARVQPAPVGPALLPCAPVLHFTKQIRGIQLQSAGQRPPEQVRPKVDEVIWDISDKVRPGVKNVVDDIRDQVRPAVESVVEDIKSGGKPADVIRSIVDDLKDKVKPSVDTVIEDLQDQVQPAVEAVVDDLKENLRSWFSTFNTDGFF